MLIPMDIAFPDMALVEQHIDTPRIEDVPAAIRAEMARLGVAARCGQGCAWPSPPAAAASPASP